VYHLVAEDPRTEKSDRVDIFVGDFGGDSTEKKQFAVFLSLSGRAGTAGRTKELLLR